MCYHLYRSPSWPIWAPRLPTLSQTQSYEASNVESPNDPISPMSSSLALMDSPNQFWSSSSPLSSKKREDRKLHRQSKVAAIIGTPISNTKHSDEKAKMRNGLVVINNATNKNDTGGIFKIPGAQDVLRHSFRKHEKNYLDSRNERNKSGQKTVSKPEISQPSWRGFSKTCDCIEKRNTSPVLRLADQARAVSSPGPLHRPDNPRASTLSATTTQTLR